MPGTRLSSDEQKLLDKWRNPPNNWPRPMLRSIEVSGGTGLRGLDGVQVFFRYPVAALCGPNGVGKSTILALAALAHHAPAGWVVHAGNTQPRRTGGDRTNYVFADFFVEGAGDIPAAGVTVTWRYHDQGSDSSCTFTKTRRGWGNYAQRPVREVDFLPLGRLVPAQEMTGVRTSFGAGRAPDSSVPLDADGLRRLSHIMGRRYTSAAFQTSTRWMFQTAAAGAAYTAFNMGGGESCMIALLHLIQRLPRGGLLVVEEIDAGLHAEAQVHLAETLVEACLRRQIQVICSTHSLVFLDALPRQARILLTRAGGQHQVVDSPSTRQCAYGMTGRVQPELVLYCEDPAAAALIESALPHNLLVRVRVKDVGDKTTVIRQGMCHVRGDMPSRVLCVLDGDCSTAEADGWIRSERGSYTGAAPAYLILPGNGQPPERWVVEQLQHDVYRDAFKAELGCDLASALGHIGAMDVVPNHHDICRVLAQRTGLSEADCLRKTVAAVGLQHPQMQALRDRVAQLLAGGP